MVEIFNALWSTIIELSKLVFLCLTVLSRTYFLDYFSSVYYIIDRVIVLVSCKGLLSIGTCD